MSRRVVSSKWGWRADSEAKRFRVTSELQFRMPQIQANQLFKRTQMCNAVRGVKYE